MESTKDRIMVLSLPAGAKSPSLKAEATRPAHWENVRGTAFRNPWPSYRINKDLDALKMMASHLINAPSVPDDIATQMPVMRPTWGASTTMNDSTRSEKIKATWLGHACFLVELPARQTATSQAPSRGARILFDPVFSNRCSPTQCFGPCRFTKPPCEISEVPEVDAIVISHNHYDHLDSNTIKAFSQRTHAPHVFAPLGNTELLRHIGVANEKIHCLDWWEGRRIEVEVVTALKDKMEPTPVAFDLTCTPCQHMSGRGIRDRYKSLWSSWVVQEVLPSSQLGAQDTTLPKEGVKVYFAGDTGYRAVLDGDDEDKVPTCPAFKEIGERWNGFDFAMIPIGAYLPREFMSPVHCAPQDSVRLFQDIRAKKALGMHWATWVLTTEGLAEPPMKLAEECKKAGISTNDFGVCQLGETVLY